MKQILVFLFLASVVQASAQQLYRFTYDAAGNRIKRELNPMFSGGGDDRSAEQPEDPDTRTITAEQFNVYPNPALDRLNISLQESFDVPLDVEMFDQNGRLVRQVQLSGELLTLDVSDLSTGYYALFIRAGTRYLQWKVSIVK
jgi:hypothetical protein